MNKPFIFIAGMAFCNSIIYSFAGNNLSAIMFSVIFFMSGLLSFVGGYNS